MRLLPPLVLLLGTRLCYYSAQQPLQTKVTKLCISVHETTWKQQYYGQVVSQSNKDTCSMVPV